LLRPEAQNVPADAQGKLSRFLTRLACAPSRALLLDYDGPIAPFCVERDRAVPYRDVLELLERVRSVTGTRLVLVTGRRAADAAQLLGLKRVEVWGCHGLERIHVDGSCELVTLDPATLQTMATVDELLIRHGLSSLVEYKPAAAAIHWRGLEPEAARDVMRKVQSVWSQLPDTRGLRLLRFDGGMEIRTAARNKGDVVRSIVSELGKGASIAYLGDDLTDEDAFAALQGYGLSILVRSDYRPTVADIWLRPPEEILEFLSDWVNTCGGA